MRMKRRWRCLALACVLVAGAGFHGARAAEIVLERSAVDKLVMQTLFNNGGRHDLVRGPCHAYLARPSVTLRDGRVRIRSHLTARVGVVNGNACVGIALATWTEVSGKPVPRGGTVVLGDIRVDKVDDPNLRLLLESGLVPALPGVLELDVLKAVRGMLQDNAGQFETTVDPFTITAISAADDRLSVTFDFLLVAR